jgi:hypothetical protein
MEGKVRQFISPEDLQPLTTYYNEIHGTFPLVNNIMYPAVTLDRRMTWRYHIERTVAKALREYVRTYSTFKRKRLSTNIKLTLDKALIGPVMTYGCPTWEYAMDVHLLKLQRLQNRVLHVTGIVDRHM